MSRRPVTVQDRVKTCGHPPDVRTGRGACWLWCSHCCRYECSSCIAYGPHRRAREYGTPGDYDRYDPPWGPSLTAGDLPKRSM